jgi:hypothetical protein
VADISAPTEAVEAVVVMVNVPELPPFPIVRDEGTPKDELSLDIETG